MLARPRTRFVILPAPFRSVCRRPYHSCWRPWQWLIRRSACVSRFCWYPAVLGSSNANFLSVYLLQQAHPDKAAIPTIGDQINSMLSGRFRRERSGLTKSLVRGRLPKDHTLPQTSPITCWKLRDGGLAKMLGPSRPKHVLEFLPLTVLWYLIPSA